jgi:hypothetical protein
VTEIHFDIRKSPPKTTGAAIARLLVACDNVAPDSGFAILSKCHSVGNLSLDITLACGEKTLGWRQPWKQYHRPQTCHPETFRHHFLQFFHTQNKFPKNRL